MSQFINVGVRVGESRPMTKKALKEALKDKAQRVVFDQTSAFPNGHPHFLYPELIPNGVKLTVVGPDPYTSRKWYATVELDKNGKVKVS